MFKFIILVLFSASLLTTVVCYRELCSSKELQVQSCSKQLLGNETEDESLCSVHFYPTNSSQCKAMPFSAISDNPALGEVRLKPYFWDYNNEHLYNFTVFNISFTDINWRTMRFRFERNGSNDSIKNHCRKIDIDKDVVLQKQWYLYYDCHWSMQHENYAGENYIFDYEAEGEAGITRGRFYFTVPDTDSLAPDVKFESWQPFVYVEIKTTAIKLYVTQPPENMGIEEYLIEFMLSPVQKCDGKNDTAIDKINLKSGGPSLDVIMYEHKLLLDSGYYYFIVTPIKAGVVGRKVRSPIIFINSDAPITVICIASITSLLVSCLFAYYILLRIIRKYFCVEEAEKETIIPPKILVIYSPHNKLHKECVVSLINYLKLECGFQVMYDADIATTQHKDPYVWCQESFSQAVHIINVVSPAVEQNNSPFTNIRNVDSLQLEMLKNTKYRASKSVLNLVFPHCKNIKSNVVAEKTFYLLKDWQKFISFISKNLLPHHQLSRSENGRTLLADFKSAKQFMNEACQLDDVVTHNNVKKLEKDALI